MKKPHKKGIANHLDFESCAGGGNVAGEALSNKNTPVQFHTAWKAEDLEPTKGGARLSIPAKRGALLFVPLLESRP